MRPFNYIFGMVLLFGSAILLGFTHEKRKATKVWTWVGVVLVLMLVRGFMPDDIGPASWSGVYDWIMPDGYAQHSVETAISVDEHWIVGETKACKSYPYIPQSASFFRKGIGYAADSLNCDDGPMHMVKATLYGRLNQPEHRIAYWLCTRGTEVFTCRQTGAE
jgi:hypothetical protein